MTTIERDKKQLENIVKHYPYDSTELSMLIAKKMRELLAFYERVKDGN